MKKEWWHGMVAYQIYPKSFCDTNGDGIGDLRGVITHLDYLKSLGVDIIWLSPIYRSPFIDQGYDISDYYDIDPTFGTMADMDELLYEAKKRNMHILMDLVVNHCSDKHIWFQKALADPDGEYGKYFYIREGKPDGTPPCNWRSYFGGSVWEKIPGTKNKYYLHMFAKEQPDLNWENPVVRDKIYEMINWWLDKGLSGFRIDAIINIKKDLNFRDYPADRTDGLCSFHNMIENAVGVGDFLTEMRDRTFRPHNALSIAEAFNIRDGEMPLFVGDNGYFSSIFDFSTEILGASTQGWHAMKKPTVNEIRNTLYESQLSMGDHGFFCNIIENHDEPRGASRYLPESGCNDFGKKLLAVTMFMRRGMPFLFQGQEIGMTNCHFDSIDEINDINTIDQYHTALKAGLSEEEALRVVQKHSRDNARTPMQWSSGKNAGFSDAEPWMKVNPNYTQINVEAQADDPDSVLNFYRALASLRKYPMYHDVIVYGSFEPVMTEFDHLYAFYRKTASQSILVLANCQNQPQAVTLPDTLQKTLLLDNYQTPGTQQFENLEISGSTLILQPYQSILLI